ncbi:hypothetical protein ACF9IK_30410 [Kitasatospora hibisci]|uniref:hypothetical protein n=1 Tax=Kitasatospora hibisci TaxID=3369522 RepID=UPI003754EE39
MSSHDGKAHRRTLPRAVEDIRLTYTSDESWWYDQNSELDSWSVSADVWDLEAEERVSHVGSFHFVRIDPYEMHDVFDLLDGFDGDLGVVASAIIDPATNDYRDEIDNFAEPGAGSATLILNTAVLEPEWRGFGLGVILAGRAIKRLGVGCRTAVCFPAPLDGAKGQQRSQAINAIGAAWQRLGFEHFRDGTYVLDLGTITFGENLDALTKKAEQLPQPALDDQFQGVPAEGVGVGGQASGSTSGCVNRTGLPSDRA